MIMTPLMICNQFLNKPRYKLTYSLFSFIAPHTLLACIIHHQTFLNYYLTLSLSPSGLSSSLPIDRMSTLSISRQENTNIEPSLTIADWFSRRDSQDLHRSRGPSAAKRPLLTGLPKPVPTRKSTTAPSMPPTTKICSMAIDEPPTTTSPPPNNWGAAQNDSP